MKSKCPYSYSLRSREAMMQYIEDIGGYDRFPLSFNVKAHHTDFSLENLRKVYYAEEGGMPDTVGQCPRRIAAWNALCEEQYEEHKALLWEWGQEGAWDGVEDSDTYRSLWNGKTVSAKFGLLGRSGGHLVIMEWNGWNFYGKHSSELREMFMDNCTVAYDQLRLLYMFCVQWTKEFTGVNASKEIEYHAAFCLFENRISAEWVNVERRIAALEQAERGPAFGQRRISVRRTDRV